MRHPKVDRRRRRALTPAAALPLSLAFGIVLGACGGSNSGMLSGTELMDPSSCVQCHPRHVEEWERSMHAYASDDPVFVAMNRRGQRDTDGGLKDFCVKCHAPLALRLGLTTDGLNLASLPKSMRGVTCYFCHLVESVTGTHDAALALAKDDVLRGGISDPLSNGAHRASYSKLHDREQLESSSLCGSCHDIINTLGAPLERTFQEWQGSVFSKAETGGHLSCSKCHMTGRSGVAAEHVQGVRLRTVHSHAFPAVDTALALFSTTDDMARAEVQSELDGAIQARLCVEERPGRRIHVELDNVAAGHRWPSGATQDRRAFIEVIAYKADRIIYQSGVVPDHTAPESAPDPDAWLMRDCIANSAGGEVHMFWEAASIRTNTLPAQLTANRLDPRFYQSHVTRRFPRTSTTSELSELPDRATMRVRLQPISIAVLDDLVRSKDLDPSIPSKMPTLDLAATKLTWTSRTSTLTLSDQREQLRCVSNGLAGPIMTSSQARSNASCVR